MAAAPATDADVTRVLDAYRAAVLAQDAEALISLYTADVRVFDLWAAWSEDGLVARRTAVEEWFGSLGEETVHVSTSDVRSHLGADLAVVECFTRFEARSPDGEVLRWMSNRTTRVLVPDVAGEWRIAHEHTSAPVDPATGAAVLQR
ncbi:MAG TPA: nuclear transport factor 2 family protein [Cellulomonas sp.]